MLRRMDARPLGTSGLEVSPLALGSWRTFERIGPDRGLAVMTASRDAGITFLDDARYNDETGTAPITTGYSEVLFGELFRAAGWRRDETVVTNKLWWELWPEQSAAEELDGSLTRMGFDHIDVIYANPPPAGLSLEELVSSVAALVASGKARAWAVVNWPGDQLLALAAEVDRQGVSQPCAVQLPYSLVRRDWVEGDDMTQALAACGAPVVASYALAGGVLTGKYDRDPTVGRAAGMLEEPANVAAMATGRRLVELAGTLDTTPATLAVAFALAQPSVVSVLFGATSPQQVGENVAALDLLARLSTEQLAALASIR
jgi:aryl-alcohol dehydrogenase-like predicted oxidoreductase